MAVAVSMATTSCGDNDGDNKEVVLDKTTPTSQTIFADQTSGDLKFSAVGDWTATVDEYNTRAGGSNVSWLTLSQYSGGAGTYNLTMTILPNYTGATRKVEIRIVCGSTTITIIIEQKETNQDGTQPVEPMRYISKIEDIEGWIVNLTYDSQNRLIKVSYPTNEGEDGSIYQYETNSIQVRSIQPYDPTDKTVYSLVNGVVINGVGYESGTIDLRNYTYTTDGYLKDCTYGDEPSPEYSLTWEDGNLTKITSYSEEDSDFTHTHTYTYTNIPNKNLSIDLVHIGMIFGIDGTFGIPFGKTIKNLPSSRQYVEIDISGNRETYKYDFTYEFDNDGYVTKMYEKESRDAAPEMLYSFTYRE